MRVISGPGGVSKLPTARWRPVSVSQSDRMGTAPPYLLRTRPGALPLSTAAALELSSCPRWRKSLLAEGQRSRAELHDVARWVAEAPGKRERCLKPTASSTTTEQRVRRQSSRIVLPRSWHRTG